MTLPRIDSDIGRSGRAALDGRRLKIVGWRAITGEA
jgi:hypothetical protein